VKVSRKRSIVKKVSEPVKSILDEALEIIHGDREKNYGDPGRNTRAIADLWRVHLKHKYGVDVPLAEVDVCQFMIYLKMARLMHSPTHRDSKVDIAGYIGLLDRIDATK
jgi:hypothetical protein